MTNLRPFLCLLGFPGGSAVKNLPAMQETRFDPRVRKICWRRKWRVTSVFLPGKSQRRRSLEGYIPCVCLVTQSYLTLCDPMDCSPLGSSVRRISQARILKWVAIFSFRGSSNPGIKWVTKESDMTQQLNNRQQNNVSSTVLETNLCCHLKFVVAIPERCLLRTLCEQLQGSDQTFFIKKLLMMSNLPWLTLRG